MFVAYLSPPIVFLYITSSAEGVQNTPDHDFTGHQRQFLNKVGCISQADSCRTLIPVTFIDFEVPQSPTPKLPDTFSRMAKVITHLVGCLPSNSAIGRSWTSTLTVPAYTGSLLEVGGDRGAAQAQAT